MGGGRGGAGGEMERRAHDFAGGRCTPRPCLRRALRCLRAPALGFGGADDGALRMTEVRMTARCAPAGDDDGAVQWPQGGWWGGGALGGDALRSLPSR